MKKSSLISVSKVGNLYNVSAAGAFGGGYQTSGSAADLPGLIMRGWQLYGANPLGCEIVGTLTPEAKELVEKLKNAGTEKETILLRMPALEIDNIRAAAERENRTVTEWCRLKLQEAVLKKK